MKKTIISLLLAGLAGAAFGATEADVEASFNPYKNGMPSFPGLKAGTVITQANADQFKDALTPGMYRMLKEGGSAIDATIAGRQFRAAPGRCDRSHGRCSHRRRRRSPQPDRPQ